MSTEEFRQNFLQVCADHGTEPPESVLEALNRSETTSTGSGYSISFATHNINSKACTVLARCLKRDRTFREISFTDCMLAEEVYTREVYAPFFVSCHSINLGLRALIVGLSENTFCQKLDLKGNNIRGSTAELVGRFLKHNKSLLSLSLEWNQLGIVDFAFSAFSDGLSVNQTLEILDLRNNQLTADCAKDLARALRKNAVVRVLDLRWNNIGLIGGRELLTAMDHNQLIQQLNVIGNNIPADVLKALETIVGHNSERERLTEEFRSKTDLLSREVQAKDRTRKRHVNDLLTKLDEKDSNLRSSSQQSMTKISQLQEMLQDRKQTHNQLLSKLSMTESKLELSESRNSELSQHLHQAGEEKEDLIKHFSADLKKEKDRYVQMESKYLRSESDLQENNSKLSLKVEDLERSLKNQKEQIFDLREQLTHNQADLKLRQGQLDEKLQQEKQRCRDEIHDLEESKLKEANRARQECDSLERTWKERLSRLESQRSDLDEELGRLRNQLTAEKLAGEDQLVSLKHKMRQEEDQRIHQLEEKIRLVQISKDELHSQNSHLSSASSELHTKNSSLQLEIESLKRKIEDLQQDLSGKQAEVATEVGLVKMEWEQKVRRLEGERLSQQEIYSKIERLEKQLADERSQHADDLRERTNEAGVLRDSLRQREAELQRMQDDELHRVHALKSAVLQFCKTSSTGGSSVNGIPSDSKVRGDGGSWGPLGED